MMSGPGISEELARRFVGKKADYYITKWTRLRQRQIPMSWNWAAFSLGPIWMAYRKMLALGYVVVVLQILTAHLASGFGYFLFAVPTMLAFGLFANYYYLIIADKRITEAETRLESVASVGGTSIKKVGLLFIMCIPFSTVTLDEREYSLLQFLFPR